MPNKRDYSIPGRRYFGVSVAQASQSGLRSIEGHVGMGFSRGGYAKVLKTYSDRNTCDIETWNGATVHNVPVRIRGGVINGEIYGEVDLPQEGDLVIVSMTGGQENQPCIVGTIIPFLDNTWSNGTPVNSTNKQFTTKLLEANKPKTYKRIFPSGLSIEIQDDATVIIEKPDNTWFKLGSDGSFEIHDAADNSIVSSIAEKSVTINEHFKVKQ